MTEEELLAWEAEAALRGELEEHDTRVYRVRDGEDGRVYVRAVPDNVKIECEYELMPGSPRPEPGEIVRILVNMFPGQMKPRRIVLGVRVYPNRRK